MQGRKFSKKAMASLHENPAVFWLIFHRPLTFCLQPVFQKVNKRPWLQQLVLVTLGKLIVYFTNRCYGFLKGDLSLKKNMSSQSGCSVPVLCLLKAWLLIATIVLIGRLCPEQHSSHFSHFLPAGTSSRGMLWGKEKSHLSDTCAVARAQRGLFPTTSGLC